MLLERGIEDEDVVIPTLAFAKYATGTPEYDDLLVGTLHGAVKKPAAGDLAGMLLAAGWVSPREAERAYQGWEFAGMVEGVPLIRVLPFTVFAEQHRGTRVLKHIRIQVLSRYAQPESVRERYEQVLEERGIQWESGGSGCVSYNFWGGYLDAKVRPTDELIYKDAGDSLDRELIESHKDYFLRKAYPGAYPSEQPDDYPYPYPSPRYIEASYEALRGPLRSKKPTGIAKALDLYGRPESRTAGKAIPAFVAWHLNAHVVPAAGRPGIARTLNKHLLVPCGKEPLPEDSWRTDDTVWRDAKELSERFERLRRAGYEKPIDKPIV